ncbi:unnamed protein product, partial [Musa hybrid cultivar]
MGNQQKQQESWHSMNQGKPPGRKAGRHHNKNRRNRSNNPTLCSLPSFFFSL